MLASGHHALHHGSAVVKRLYLKYFSIYSVATSIIPL